MTLPTHLSRISPWRSCGALLCDWALIGACFAVAMYFPHPLTYLLAAILIARTQLALSVLMHESAHGLLSARRGVNDFIGQVCIAAPLMISLFSYRKGHMQHHRAPMASNDPVAVIFGIADYPIPRRELIWRLLKDVSSIAYFLSVFDLIRGKHRGLVGKASSRPARTLFVLASIVGTNALLIAVLAGAGHAWLYLGLWILPALTFLQVFARIRAITEHAAYLPGEDQIQNARSIVRPNWQTFFFGPHRVHYHIEHHQYVRVPFYHLRETHQLMKSRGLLPEANLYRSYGKVLRDVSF
ncbi:fatty acid desaturase [Oxalobacteraceae bacterium GrIS 1.11]